MPKLLGTSREQLKQYLALRPSDLLTRIVAVETAVGINRLFAGLARDRGVDASLELVDGRALPASSRRHDRWWPSGVDAYGCLRAGELCAPFLWHVAWDRAQAPAAHRRARVAAWHRFDVRPAAGEVAGCLQSWSCARGSGNARSGPRNSSDVRNVDTGGRFTLSSGRPRMFSSLVQVPKSGWCLDGAIADGCSSGWVGGRSRPTL